MNSVLMTELTRSGLPVASSCHGDGVCSKCHIKIISGQENLSPESELERTLKKRNRVPENHRISCQTRIFGDVVIDADYW